MLKYELEGGGVFLEAPACADYQAGMVINDGAKEGLAFFAVNDKIRAVHKVGNPEVIDVRLLELFTRCRSRFFLDEIIVGNKLPQGSFA